MKNLFLFLAVSAFALTSCSNDDDNNSSDSITLKINGESKTLNNVVVSEASDETDTRLYITGTIEGSTTDIFTFEVFQGDVGADVADFFTYTTGGQSYIDNSGLDNNVTTNNNGRLKGTFSGTMQGLDSESNVVTATIAEGQFDISY